MDLQENLIRCTNVPSNLLLTEICHPHFEQFGTVTRLEVNPDKSEILVGFEKMTSALNAMTKGNTFEGNTLTMNMQSLPPSYVVKKKRTKKTEDMDEEIKEELMAMGGYQHSEPEMSELLKRKKEIKRELKRSFTSENILSKVKKRNYNTDSMKSEQKELLNIMSKSAATEEEKFKILEARDKLLRLLLHKKRNISIAKRTIGTCPDMCPEKERLMRVFQHQVSLFEQDLEDKSMNHCLAVKQYSRSSADQESPLQHDLRNVKVLAMTMGYLMHEIMNLCDYPETNLGDWFHFLWDRTRALRKDITQQELCCKGSVEIIEQCARFHIFCSARLVAEEPMVFDQKINTENLTKCLQTLKYFYDDLALKNQSCPNEPEFRAYIILLNLNDGAIMWEIQHLKPSVQKSPEVRFALAACSALDKNNYVKFFKLVRSTTYLNACILLRYFIQLRLKAISVKVKASVAHRTPPVPINELQDMLGFEDFDATVDFFHYYGLPTNELKTHIVFDKQYYSLPDAPFPLERAMNLIESKRDKSVGEIICGKKLPPRKFESHVPENSFDNLGYLIKSKLHKKIELLMTKNSPAVTAIKRSPAVSDRSSSPSSYEVPSKVKITKSIFDKEIDSNSQSSIFGGKKIFQTSEIPPFRNTIKSRNENSMDVFKNVQTKLFENTQPQKSNIFKNRFFSNKSSDSNLSIFKNPVLTNTRNMDEPDEIKGVGGFSFEFTDKNLIEKEKELRLKQENENQIKMIQEQNQRAYEESERIKMEALKQQEEIERQILIEKSRLLELEQKRKEELEQKRREEMKRKKMDLERQQLELQRVHTLKLLQLEKQQALEETKKQKQMEELKLKKKREMEEFLKNEKIKREVSDVLESLLKTVEDDHKKETLSILRYRYLTRFVIIRWRKKVATNNRKRKAIDHSPVWVVAKTLKETAKDFYMGAQEMTLNLMKRYKQGLPININTNFDTTINKINLFELTYGDLCKNLQLLNDIYWKVNISTNKNSKFLGLINDVLDSYINWENYCYLEQQKVGAHAVYYCLEKTIDRCKDSGNNGLIFISDELNESFLSNISDNVKNLTKNTCIPISIIVQKSIIDEELLEDLVDTNKISNYKIFTSTFLIPNLLNSINGAFKFLSSNAKAPPDLQLNLLQNFLVENMGSDLWHRISGFAKWNDSYKKCLRSPKIVVGLYNEALERIQNLIFTDSCYDHTDFSLMFKSSKVPVYLPCDYKFFPQFWKDPMYKGLIIRKIGLLKLPQYTFKWPPTDQSELEINIYNYCVKVFKNPEQVFYRIMASILKNLDADFMDEISWLDIIKVLSNEKIKEFDFKISVEFFDRDIFEELFIVYEISALKVFQSEAWFYLSNPLITNQITKNLQELPEEDKNLVLVEISDDEYDINLDDTLRDIATNWDFDDVIADQKEEMKKFNNMMEDLEESISLQKKTSSKFQSLLVKILDDN